MLPNLLGKEVHGARDIEPRVGPSEKAFRPGREGDVRLERPKSPFVEGGDGVAPLPQPGDLSAQCAPARLVPGIGPRDHAGRVEPEAPLAELSGEGAVVLESVRVQPVIVLSIELGRRIEPGEARPAGSGGLPRRRADGAGIEEGHPRARPGEGECRSRAHDAGADHDRVEGAHWPTGEAARLGARAGAARGVRLSPLIGTVRRALRRGTA